DAHRWRRGRSLDRDARSRGRTLALFFVPHRAFVPHDGILAARENPAIPGVRIVTDLPKPAAHSPSFGGRWAAPLQKEKTKGEIMKTTLKNIKNRGFAAIAACLILQQVACSGVDPAALAALTGALPSATADYGDAPDGLDARYNN